jgi:hypothetical protein
MNIGHEVELARHTQFHEVRDHTTYLNVIEHTRDDPHNR